MTGSISKNTSKSILSRITLDEFIAAVNTLGDRIDYLQHETWRLNKTVESPTSLWDEIIDKLKLNHDENTRHALYNLLRSKHHNVHQLLEKRQIALNEEGIQEDDDKINEKDSFLAQNNNKTLASDPSFPLPEPLNTRAYQKGTAMGKINKHCFIKTQLISLTRHEWKNAFSRTDRKTRPGWTNIFDGKLVSIGNTCSLHFDSVRAKTGNRKRNCSDFWFPAYCNGNNCNRKYIVSHRKELDDHLMVGFRVNVFGEENHNETNVMRSRNLSGKERDAVGKIFQHNMW